MGAELGGSIHFISPPSRLHPLKSEHCQLCLPKPGLVSDISLYLLCIEYSRFPLVTGASQGLGRVVTERVLEAGHNVVATMRKPEVFQSLQQQYPSERLLVLALDVTDPVQVEDAFAKAKESVKRIDVVFNNAGTCLVGDAEAVPNDVAKSLMEVRVPVVI